MKVANKYPSNADGRKHPFRLVAFIGSVFTVGYFIWLTAPYYRHVFYENGNTNGIILMLFPSMQAVDAVIPALVLAGGFFLMDLRRKKRETQRESE